MNYKFENSIEILKNKAQCSQISYKHAAALIYKENIYSTGFNKFLKVKSFQINKEKSIYYKTIHAEINAICQIPKHLAKGKDILVIRINKNLDLKNSRPCNHCIEKLLKIGIRKVHYSNEFGIIISEFLSDMEKTHTSAGSMYINNNFQRNLLK